MAICHKHWQGLSVSVCHWQNSPTPASSHGRAGWGVDHAGEHGDCRRSLCARHVSTSAPRPSARRQSQHLAILASPSPPPPPSSSSSSRPAAAQAQEASCCGPCQRRSRGQGHAHLLRQHMVCALCVCVCGVAAARHWRTSPSMSCAPLYSPTSTFDPGSRAWCSWTFPRRTSSRCWPPPPTPTCLFGISTRSVSGCGAGPVVVLCC